MGFIFFFIDFLPYFPVTGTNNPDDSVRTVSVSDKHDTRSNLSEEPPTKFRFSTRAMNFIERDNGKRIAKCLFSFEKWYAVFSKIGGFLPGVPGKLHQKTVASND